MSADKFWLADERVYMCAVVTYEFRTGGSERGRVRERGGGGGGGGGGVGGGGGGVGAGGGGGGGD